MNPQTLLLVMSDMISFDALIDQLDESIKNYQISPTKENQQKIFFNSLLVVTKQKVDAEGGLDSAMKSLKEAKEAYEVGSRITGADKMS